MDLRNPLLSAKGLMGVVPVSNECPLPRPRGGTVHGAYVHSPPGPASSPSHSKLWARWAGLPTARAR
jgi:hypothetical protein